MNELLTISIEVKHTFSTEDISDLLVTAFEGGINYWCDKIKIYQTPEGFKGKSADEIVANGGSVKVFIIDEDETHILTLEKMMNGIKQYCIEIDENPKDLIDNHDACTVDTILQYALFNEQVYG